MLCRDPLLHCFTTRLMPISLFPPPLFLLKCSLSKMIALRPDSCFKCCSLQLWSLRPGTLCLTSCPLLGRSLLLSIRLSVVGFYSTVLAAFKCLLILNCPKSVFSPALPQWCYLSAQFCLINLPLSLSLLLLVFHYVKLPCWWPIWLIKYIYPYPHILI